MPRLNNLMPQFVFNIRNMNDVKDDLELLSLGHVCLTANNTSVSVQSFPLSADEQGTAEDLGPSQLPKQEEPSLAE